MKTREEQIAEMAQAMGDFELKDTVKCDIELSEHLFAKGYRKQNDTVREFVRRIKEIYDKMDRLYRDYDIIALWSDIIHLAVEYGALAQNEEGYVEKEELEE